MGILKASNGEKGEGEGFRTKKRACSRDYSGRAARFYFQYIKFPSYFFVPGSVIDHGSKSSFNFSAGRTFFSRATSLTVFPVS